MTTPVPQRGGGARKPLGHFRHGVVCSTGSTRPSTSRRCGAPCCARLGMNVDHVLSGWNTLVQRRAETEALRPNDEVLALLRLAPGKAA